MMHVRNSVFHPWMLDPNMTHGDVVFDGRPFDHVLVSSLLHDIIVKQTPKDYMASLGEWTILRAFQLC